MGRPCDRSAALSLPQELRARKIQHGEGISEDEQVRTKFESLKFESYQIRLRRDSKEGANYRVSQVSHTDSCLWTQQTEVCQTSRLC